MKNRSLLTVTLLAASICLHSPAPAKTPRANHDKPTTLSGVTADDTTMALINRGDWSAVAARLSVATSPFDRAWLAFAYMYLGKAAECEKVAAAYTSSYAADDLESAQGRRVAVARAIIQSMNSVAHARFREAALTLADKKIAEMKEAQDNALYHFAIACVAGKTNQSEAACAHARRAYECDSRFYWALRTIAFLQEKKLKDIAAAEATLSEWLAAMPESEEARDMLIETRLLRKDFDGAIDEALRAIKRATKSGSAHYRLGQIYLQQFRLREATAQYDLAIKHDGLKREARYYRSRAAARRLAGDLSGAIEDQSVAVELSRDKVFELLELADLNIAAGNSNKAIDNLRQAITLEDENQTVREKLYKLLIAEKRYDDLAVEYSEQVAKHPKAANLRLGYANILLALGKDDKAVEEFKEAANLSQNDPAPHRALGAYYIQRKQYERAAREYTRALNIVPTSIKDMVALGYCYGEDDDFMKAEAAFVTALALQQLTPNTNPDDPGRVEVMRSLASLLYDEGRYGDAATQFENIVVGFKDKGATADDAYLLAQSKLMRDRTDSAARSMLAVYEILAPGKKEAFKYGMIEALLDVGMNDLASKALTKIEVGGDDLLHGIYETYLLRNQNMLEAAEVRIAPLLTIADQVKDGSPAAAARTYVEAARIALARGDSAKADKLAQNALLIYEKCFAAHLVMAECAIKDGDLKRATAAVRKAVQYNPYYAPAYLVLGKAQLDDNSATVKKEGLDNLRKAVELYPGSLDGHIALKAAYDRLSMAEDSKKEEALIGNLKAKVKSD